MIGGVNAAGGPPGPTGLSQVPPPQQQQQIQHLQMLGQQQQVKN